MPHNSNAILFGIIPYILHNRNHCLSVYRVLCCTANTTRSESTLSRQCTPTNSAKPPSLPTVSPLLSKASLSPISLLSFPISLLCLPIYGQLIPASAAELRLRLCSTRICAQSCALWQRLADSPLICQSEQNSIKTFRRKKLKPMDGCSAHNCLFTPYYMQYFYSFQYNNTIHTYSRNNYDIRHKYISNTLFTYGIYIFRLSFHLCDYRWMKWLFHR